MNPLRVPSGWTGEAKAFVRQVEEEREASESRLNSKVGTWKSWTPTLAWTTATPGSITTTARYCVIGKTLFFNVYIVSTDGNGATRLTVTVPVHPKESAVVGSIQRVNTTYTSPVCYVDSTIDKFGFLTFSTCTNNVGCSFRITGQYEI